MTKDEALRMAIEIMERLHQPNGNSVQLAIQACKEALAQPTTEQSSLVQEPVAWMNDIAFSMDKELLGTRSRIVALYTTPPSREWQSLSKKEVDEIVSYLWGKTEDWVRAIEAKLKEKNG